MRTRALLSTIVCLAISACNEAPSAAPDTISDSKSSSLGPQKRVVANTIDPAGTLIRNGHRLAVTGPIQCTAGEMAHLRVTVSQRSTAALAEGSGQLTCTGSLQTWHVQLSQTGAETFQDGAAIAVALARTTDRGRLTDAHQWLVNITVSE